MLPVKQVNMTRNAIQFVWRRYISGMNKTIPRPNFFARHSFAIAVIVGSISPFMHYVLGR